MINSTALGRFGIDFLGTPSLGGTQVPDRPEYQSTEAVPSEAIAALHAEYREGCFGKREEGTHPPNQLSYILARRLLEALGSGIEPTDVYFGAQGHAVLEWHPAPGMATTIHVLGDGRVRYAAARLGRRNFGIESITASIPPEIFAAIRKGGVR
jgi:hypothetical protein